MALNVQAEFRDTAPDNGVDAKRLGAYLQDRLPGASSNLTLRQFSGGNANLLYLVQFDETAYVLRRPPFGKIAPGSHDMAREFRVLSRLNRAYPLAPTVFELCEDEEVIGAPFLVMEYKPSIVIRTALPDSLVGDTIRCRRLGETIVDAMAMLHRIDPVEADLAELGNPEGYLQRQIEGWRRRWAAVADGPRPEMDRVMRWLDDNLPTSGKPALLHNDFKLDNMLLSPEEPSHCIGVVDWDMCTRGDPLAELGFLLNYWGERRDPGEWIEAASMPTWNPGFPTRAEAIERYAQKTGFDMQSLPWHRVFGPFKLAVILQQIWSRYQRGESTNERFRIFGKRVDALIRKANRLVLEA